MSKVLEAKAAIRRLAMQAKAVQEDEALTLAEKSAKLEDFKTELKGHQDTVATYEGLARIVDGGAVEDAGSTKAAQVRKTLGRHMVESAAYKSAVASKGGRFSTTLELGTKAGGPTFDTEGEGTSLSGGFLTGPGGAVVMPDFLPGIVPILLPQLVVADLFAQGATTSELVSYVKESAEQLSAAGVAEAGAYPQSDVHVEREVAQVGKIAHFHKVTDEMLADAAQFESFVNERMTLGLQQKEQTELLVGTGMPSVLGLLDSSRTGKQTALTPDGSTDVSVVIDALYTMATNIRFNAFVEPDAILVNPVDWSKIRLAKDKNGQYYAGGPFSGAYGNGGYSNVDAVWGFRVVQTPAIASGTMAMGAFRTCAQIFRRAGIVLEMTNSDGTDFQNGIVTVRASERLALVAYRMGGFGLVTPSWTVAPH